MEETKLQATSVGYREFSTRPNSSAMPAPIVMPDCWRWSGTTSACSSHCYAMDYCYSAHCCDPDYILALTNTEKLWLVIFLSPSRNLKTRNGMEDKRNGRQWNGMEGETDARCTAPLSPTRSEGIIMFRGIAVCRACGGHATYTHSGSLQDRPQGVPVLRFTPAFSGLGAAPRCHAFSGSLWLMC
jgi:hypothetical protein